MKHRRIYLDIATVLIASFILVTAAIIITIIWADDIERKEQDIEKDIYSSYEYSSPVFNGLAQAGLSKSESHNCLRWAFGDDVMTARRNELPSRWNERHSGIFTIYGDDDTIATMIKVGKAYLNQKELIHEQEVVLVEE